MAWARIARSSQLSQSLSRIASEGGVLTLAASALRNAAALGPRSRHAASLFHSLACVGLADKCGAGAAGHLYGPRRGISATPARLLPAAAEPVAAEYSDTEDPAEAMAALPDLGPTGLKNKPRVVVLGSGRAACRFLKDVDTSAYDVVCVSPRNHMVFTPLLASGDEQLPTNPYRFRVAYDKLVIASGAEPLTFNIKGVQENAIFLREVNEAQQIRRKLLTNLMLLAPHHCL